MVKKKRTAFYVLVPGFALVDPLNQVVGLPVFGLPFFLNLSAPIVVYT